MEMAVLEHLTEIVGYKHPGRKVKQKAFSFLFAIAF